MNIEFDINNLASSIKSMRLSLNLSQLDIAKKCNLRRELIVRAERGDNVGVHHVVAIINAMNSHFEIKENKINEVIYVNDFDQFYDVNFRKPLELERDSHASHSENIMEAGLFNKNSKLSFKESDLWKSL